MHRETRATAIPAAVKARVWARDLGRCVICGDRNAGPHCHYVRRSQGGMGIESNIWTGCDACHRAFDSEGRGGYLHQIVKRHLERWYPGWDEKNQIYHKWRDEG